MKHAATISFVDAESKDEACVIVRYDQVSVCLAVSHKKDGDIEVRMSKDDARVLLDGLMKATSTEA